MPPEPAKIMLPSARNAHEYILVNSKQAHRISIMRNKRRKRMGQMLELGIDVNPELIGSRYAMSRKKDRVRMKVANSRNRVQGLFVNK